LTVVTYLFLAVSVGAHGQSFLIDMFRGLALLKRTALVKMQLALGLIEQISEHNYLIII